MGPRLQPATCKRGDRFEILYEEVLLEGQPHAVGAILALVYENEERRHEAYRYGDYGTYYDGEGRPLRKMFLRSPLRYSRITSHFTHPPFPSRAQDPTGHTGASTTVRRWARRFR